MKQDNQNRPNLTLIIADNEKTVQSALDSGNYFQAFLLVHSLIESLLRAFLNELEPEKDLRFAELVDRYKKHLTKIEYAVPSFVDELTQFNRRRNRIVHRLWRYGFTYTNNSSKDAAHSAANLYGLFIDWLQTFDEGLADLGFKLSSQK